MKKQRWRKTKKKKWFCENKCGKVVYVESHYKQEFCCSGIDCGCGGFPTNPVLCYDCEKKIFGDSFY